MASVLDSPYWNWFGGGGDTGAGNFYNNDPSGPPHDGYYSAVDILRQAQARNLAGGLPISANHPALIPAIVGAGAPVVVNVLPDDNAGAAIMTTMGVSQTANANSIFPLLALGVLALLLLRK